MLLRLGWPPQWNAHPQFEGTFTKSKTNYKKVQTLSLHHLSNRKVSDFQLGKSGSDYHLLTWEADLKHYSLLPVFDRTDGGELVVEQAKEGARQQAHQAHKHTIVAGICILVEDTVETLTADVNIALVHNGGKDHQGEYLWMGGGGRGDRKWEMKRKMKEMSKLFPVWSTYFWLCLSASPFPPRANTRNGIVAALLGNVSLSMLEPLALT